MSDLTTSAATGLARAQSVDGALSQAGRKLSGERSTQAIREAAEEFEAVFLAQMLQPMFNTLETNEMFGGGPGEEQYRQLLVDEYGKQMARAGGIGLADHVMAQMLKLQEVKP